MEEAKDLRELKSLLSGLSLHGNSERSLNRGQTSSADSSAQKIVLLKSVSVFLFSLSLFLSLLLLFFLVRFYLVGPSYNDKQHTMVQPPVLEEAQAATAPAPVATEPPALALPAVHEVVLNEVVPAAKEDLTAEKKEPPAVILRDGGGSLYFIALKHYGKADETIFDLILQANPAITDVRKIDDYQKIILPEITAESYIKGSSQDGYRVYVGTFETSQWAELYGASMKRKEKRVYIEAQHFSSQDTWYRLTTGDFDTREDALQAVRSLQKRGLIYIPPQPA